MIFEAKHSLLENEYTQGNGSELTFPAHIHRSFEYFLQLKGRTQITVDDKIYVLSPGEAVFIFPFQIHSYLCLEKGEFESGIFSKELIPDFVKKTENLLPESNLFTGLEGKSYPTDNFFLCKSHAYRICGEFDKNRAYTKKSFKADDDILLTMLLYAEEHFCDECTLRETAKAVGYDYAYVSKYFKKKMGMAYNKYVNLLRVTKSMSLLKNTSKSIVEIVSECGFGTQRGFNRNFYGELGMTPSDYRKKDAEK